MIRRVIFLVVYYLYARRKLRGTSTVLFNGLTLVIPPTVFHPKLYFSTTILAKYLSQLTLQGKTLLEMGCGSGALSLFAISRGAGRVTAVDINPKAVECARSNAELNGLAGGVEVFQSDLFVALPPESRYDYIFWNPPFFPHPPRDIPNHDWNAGENYLSISNFSKDVGKFLTPGGVVILILSSYMDIPHVLKLFTSQGFTTKLVNRARRLFEVFSIFEFRMR